MTEVIPAALPETTFADLPGVEMGQKPIVTPETTTLPPEVTEADITLLGLAQSPMVATIIRNVALRAGLEPEDLMQEVLVRATMQSKVLDSNIGPRVYGWTKRVATNFAVDQFRRAERRPQSVSLEVLCPPAAVENGFDHIEKTATLTTVLARLSPEHRTALETVFLQDLTCEQAAEALGWPLGTVKSRIFYGLKHARGIAQELGITAELFP